MQILAWLAYIAQSIAEQLLSIVASIWYGLIRMGERLFGVLMHPQLARSVATVLAIVVIGGLLWTAAAVGVTYGMPLYSQFFQDKRAQHYRDIADRAMAVALFDSQDRFIGYLNHREEKDVVDGKRPVDVLGYEITPDHKSMDIDDSPSWYWRCLVTLEDKRTRSPLNPWGIDLWGMVQIPPAALMATIEQGKPSLGRGGSTIHMQLVRSMLKRFPGSKSNPLYRRWVEYRDATVLSKMLKRHDGDDPLRRWAALHMPHIQGGPEGTIYGVETAAYVLWGQPAVELTPARQFVLAASVNHPIQILSQSSTDAWRRLTFGYIDRNDKLHGGRAKLCVDKLIHDKDLRKDATQELADLAAAPPPIGIDPALIPIVQRNGGGDRGLRVVASSPELLAGRVAGDVGRGVVAELRDQYGPRYRNRVGRIRLTLDVVKNQAFRAKLAETLRRVDTRLGDSLNRGRFALDLSPASVPIVVAAADEKGRIVRYVDNSPQTPYFGLAARRVQTEAGLGAYKFDQETRQIGSVSKLAAALALADRGAENASTRWNNACVLGPGRRCACKGCAGPSTVTARNAFALSLNDALINHLRAEPASVRDKIDPIFAAFDFNTPQEHIKTPVETRAALGFVAATPRAVEALAAATLAAASGDSKGSTFMPSLIDKYLPIDSDKSSGEWQDFAGTTALKRSANLKVGSQGAAFLRDALSAPVCDEEGTLAALKAWCPDGTRVKSFIAKTGTPSANLTGTFTEFDWWLTGAIAFADGRTYSYVVLIGTGNPRLPFARSGAGSAAAVVDALLTDLYADKPGGGN